MIDGLLVLGVVFVLGLYYFNRHETKAPTVSSTPTRTDIRCPSCQAQLLIEGMLDKAVFFDPGAIIFDCSHCHNRIYFAPYEDNVEVGKLGCSPVVDPIPHESYAYPQGFGMRSNIQDGVLTIEIKEKTWKIPSYRLWNERADIPCPNPAVKRDAPNPVRPLP